MKMHRRGVYTLEWEHLLFTHTLASQAKLAEIQEALLGKLVNFCASNEWIAILIEHKIANRMYIPSAIT